MKHTIIIAINKAIIAIALLGILILVSRCSAPTPAAVPVAEGCRTYGHVCYAI